jgi:hypothetical protein
MSAPEMAARRGSRCQLCKKWIRAGEYIAKIPGGHWVHAICAHRLRLTREEEGVSDFGSEDAA